jgi:molecular chaperone DnaK (HSP70)
MKKSFITDINEINKNIKEAEIMLKESMGFCSEESIEDTEMEEEPVEQEIEPEMPEIAPVETNSAVDSYIDHIRKYTLNGLAALCDNPESEEYQMLKKIFQMCDKKAEKKENMTESHRLFGVLKESKKVLFETNVSNSKDFKTLKASLIKEAVSRGYNPADIRLVSENKIIR